MVVKDVIGRVEKVSLPEASVFKVSARIDTGAKTSAIWASGIKAEPQGQISFYLFGKSSPLYTGQKLTSDSYTVTAVASSNGMVEKRYKVKMLVRIGGRKINAAFTLANRSRQVYPILIGRNVLRGKFIVDVTKGEPLVEDERKRTAQLRAAARIEVKGK